MKHILVWCLVGTWIATACCTRREANHTTVYLTNKGNKYHRDGCRYLQKHSVPVTLEEAQDRGYEQCGECKK